MAGGIVVLVLIILSIAAPLVVSWFGHPPNEFHEQLVDADTQLPKGPFGGVSSDFLFGVEPVNGRDVFARILYGSRVSLLIAFLATLLSVLIGTTLGVVAGYFGGRIDSLISRTMDIFLAFPLLVFAIALVGAIPDRAFGLQGDSLRIAMLVFVIGFFNWPYIGRIIRGQTLSIRNREFVDAALSWEPPIDTSSARNCCPTSWHRSSCTRPCSSRRTSCSRRPSRLGALGTATDPHLGRHAQPGHELVSG